MFSSEKVGRFLGSLVILISEALGIVKTLAASVLLAKITSYYLYPDSDVILIPHILGWFLVFAAGELLRVARVHYLLTGKILFEERMFALLNKCNKGD